MSLQAKLIAKDIELRCLKQDSLAMKRRYEEHFEQLEAEYNRALKLNDDLHSVEIIHLRQSWQRTMDENAKQRSKIEELTEMNKFADQTINRLLERVKQLAARETELKSTIQTLQKQAKQREIANNGSVDLNDIAGHTDLTQLFDSLDTLFTEAENARQSN